MVHAVSAALKARPKFKIATSSTTTTTTTDEPHVEENEDAGSEVLYLKGKKKLTSFGKITERFYSRFLITIKSQIYYSTNLGSPG